MALFSFRRVTNSKGRQIRNGKPGRSRWLGWYGRRADSQSKFQKCSNEYVVDRGLDGGTRDKNPSGQAGAFGRIKRFDVTTLYKDCTIDREVRLETRLVERAVLSLGRRYEARPPDASSLQALRAFVYSETTSGGRGTKERQESARAFHLCLTSVKIKIHVVVRICFPLYCLIIARQ